MYTYAVFQYSYCTFFSSQATPVIFTSRVLIKPSGFCIQHLPTDHLKAIERMRLNRYAHGLDSKVSKKSIPLRQGKIKKIRGCVNIGGSFFWWDEVDGSQLFLNGFFVYKFYLYQRLYQRNRCLLSARAPHTHSLSQTRPIIIGCYRRSLSELDRLKPQYDGELAVDRMKFLSA